MELLANMHGACALHGAHCKHGVFYVVCYLLRQTMCARMHCCDLRLQASINAWESLRSALGTHTMLLEIDRYGVWQGAVVVSCDRQVIGCVAYSLMECLHLACSQ